MWSRDMRLESNDVPNTLFSNSISRQLSNKTSSIIIILWWSVLFFMNNFIGSYANRRSRRYKNFKSLHVHYMAARKSVLVPACSQLVLYCNITKALASSSSSINPDKNSVFSLIKILSSSLKNAAHAPNMIKNSNDIEFWQPLRRQKFISHCVTKKR